MSNRLRLTHRRQSADMSVPYPGNVNQPDRRDPDWEQYHTFEQTVNHELPDMRHEWKDDTRDDIGFGIPEKNPPAVASIRVAANKAVRIAVLLLGEKVDDDTIEAQARDLMNLGSDAMDRTLDRFAKTQALYADDDDDDDKDEEDKKASAELADKMKDVPPTVKAPEKEADADEKEEKKEEEKKADAEEKEEKDKKASKSKKADDDDDDDDEEEEGKKASKSKEAKRVWDREKKKWVDASSKKADDDEEEEEGKDKKADAEEEEEEEGKDKKAEETKDEESDEKEKKASKSKKADEDKEEEGKDKKADDEDEEKEKKASRSKKADDDDEEEEGKDKKADDDEEEEGKDKKADDEDEEEEEGKDKKADDDEEEDDKDDKKAAKKAGPNELNIEMTSAEEELEPDPEADKQLASLFEDGLTAKQEVQTKVEASKKAGIKKLGGQPKVAASDAAPADIGSIWESAPDVSSVFK